MTQGEPQPGGGGGPDKAGHQLTGPLPSFAK